MGMFSGFEVHSVTYEHFYCIISLAYFFCVGILDNSSLSNGSSYTGLFISPSGTSELDCATTKTDTTERSISIGRESLKFFFVLGALVYLQVQPLGDSRDEKWCAQ